VTRVWGALVVATGVTVVFELSGTSGRYPGPVEGAAMVAAGALYGLTGSQLGAALIAASAFAAYIGPHPATMVVFVFWASLALALFNDDEQRVALRTLAGCCYLFAAANKLFDPFLSGRILADIAPWMPATRTVAVLVVAAEAALGVLILARFRWGVLAVLALHGTIVVVTARDLAHGYVLVVYGGLLVWVTSSGLRPSLHDRGAPVVGPRRSAGDDPPGCCATDLVGPGEGVGTGAKVRDGDADADAGVLA